MKINEINYQTSANVYITVLNSPDLPGNDDNRANIRFRGPEDPITQRVINATMLKLEEVSKDLEKISEPFNNVAFKRKISLVVNMSLLMICVVCTIVGGATFSTLLVQLGAIFLCIALAASIVFFGIMLTDKKTLESEPLPIFSAFLKDNHLLLANIHCKVSDEPDVAFKNIVINTMLKILKDRIKVLDVMQNHNFFLYISSQKRSEELKQIESQAGNDRKETLWSKLKEYQEGFVVEQEIAKQQAAEAASTMATIELSTNPGEITEDFSKRFLIPTLTEYLLPEPSQEVAR